MGSLVSGTITNFYSKEDKMAKFFNKITKGIIGRYDKFNNKQNNIKCLEFVMRQHEDNQTAVYNDDLNTRFYNWIN